MTHRRSPLLAGVCLIVAGFLHPAGAKATVELQATGFEGTEGAHYGSCAGSANVRAKYGGLGITARAHPFHRRPAAGKHESTRRDPQASPRASGSSPELPSGFAITSTVAGNLVSVQLEQCEGNCRGFHPGRFPVRRSQLGGNLRLGGDWRGFGFGLGGLLWQRLRPTGQFNLSSGNDEVPAVLPDILLRFGPPDVVHVELGFGAYNAPTVLRPGAYVGLGVAPLAAWQAVAHYGLHYPLGAPRGDARLDFELRHTLRDDVQVGVGGAWTNGPERYEGDGVEGRVFVAQRY